MVIAEPTENEIVPPEFLIESALKAGKKILLLPFIRFVVDVTVPVLLDA